ncbi:hypothetical protein KSP39_PZI017165 [Platanthera zijinensis]|uniref:Uncharacterized protein n=1 Tax=Platanthera zijinensis TaxID=2320716 RepID=A0AAP0FZG3_9ASPA
MDWEKWSAFTHNKHLEEAKNCSIPGSVAQKKAYFEAHYRRAASMKSAAVLEPENDMVGNDLLCHKLGNDEQKINESSCLKAERRQKTERLLQSPCKIVDKHGLERMKGDNAGPTKLDEVHGKHSLQIKSSNNVQYIEGEAIATEIDGQMQEKPPMKVNSLAFVVQFCALWQRSYSCNSSRLQFCRKFSPQVTRMKNKIKRNQTIHW